MITETLNNPNRDERIRMWNIYKIMFTLLLTMEGDEVFGERPLKDKCELMFDYIKYLTNDSIHRLREEIDSENYELSKVIPNYDECKIPDVDDVKLLKNFTSIDILNFFNDAILKGYMLIEEDAFLLLPFSISMATTILAISLMSYNETYITLEDIKLRCETDGVFDYIQQGYEKIGDNRNLDFIKNKVMHKVINNLCDKHNLEEIGFEKINDKKFRIIHNRHSSLFQNNIDWKQAYIESARQEIKKQKTFCEVMFFIGLVLAVIGSILIASNTSLGAGIAILVIGIVIGVLGAIGGFFLSYFKTK